jgi:hypothetical protein
MPAYPQICIILGAAKILSIKNQTTLTSADQENLRILAEEIFRESICTEKWSGTADKKLKEWLDGHFFWSLKDGKPVVSTDPGSKQFPGEVKQINSNPNYLTDWKTKIDFAAPVEQRNVPKE